MPVSQFLLLLGGLALATEAASYLNPSKVPSSPVIELQTSSGAFSTSNAVSLLLWLYPLPTASSLQELLTWDRSTGKSLSLTRNSHPASNQLQLMTSPSSLSVPPQMWTCVMVSCTAAGTLVVAGSSAQQYLGVAIGVKEVRIGGKLEGYIREVKVFEQGMDEGQLRYFAYRKAEKVARMSYSLDEGYSDHIYNAGLAQGSTTIDPDLWELSAVLPPPLCPAVGYYPTANTCRPCHSRCLQCSGPTYSDCQQCRSGCLLLTAGYQTTGANTCHCPNRPNIISGGNSGQIAFPGISARMMGVTSFTGQVWTRLVAWEAATAENLMNVGRARLALFNGKEARLYADSALLGGTLFNKGDGWVHFTFVVDSTALTAQLYRNAESVATSPLPAALSTPSMLTLGGAAFKAYFREVRLYSGTRDQTSIESDWRHRRISLVPPALLVYFPLDETSGSTLHALGSQSPQHFSQPTFDFSSDEDPMLTLCEVSTAYQVPVEYENWWYCDGVSKALQVVGDLQLPLADVSSLPSSSTFYVFDVWVVLGSVLPLHTQLVSLGAFSIWSDTADNQILGLKTATALTTMSPSLEEDHWTYLKIWVKSEEIRFSLNYQTPTVLGGLRSGNLQPTELRIAGILGFQAKYIRLFSQEVTSTAFDISPTLSYTHLGDLGLQQLLSDWPLNECVGTYVYDHSWSRQSVQVSTASMWTVVGTDPQPFLSRTDFCEERDTCTTNAVPAVGILLSADQYIGCNSAGSVPTGPFTCAEKGHTQVWHSRSQQQYWLSVASPVTSGFGYEFSFWFSVNSFSTGRNNVISIGTYIQCIVDDDNSQFVIKAKTDSGDYIVLFRCAIAYQLWYSVHISHHDNPPTLNLAISGQPVPIQAYLDVFHPVDSATTVYFGGYMGMSGFDGYLADVIFYEGINRYDWRKLWLFGHSNSAIFASDSGFKALLSFTLDSNTIPDLIGISTISLSSLTTSSPLFEVPSSDYLPYPDFCPSGQFLSGSLCVSCSSACSQCTAASYSHCYKCASGAYFSFATAVCGNSCTGGLQQSAAECLPTACFPNCGTGCTDVHHYSCSVQCGSGRIGNGLGYCSGLFLNPSAGTSAISIPITANLPSGFMLEFWICPNSVPGASQEILRIGQYSLSFSPSSSHLQLLIGTAPVLTNTGFSLSPNQWFHLFLASMHSQVQLLVYSQASDDYAFASQAVFSGLYTSPLSLTIGGTDHSFNGFVTELRLWSLTSSPDISQMIVLTHSYLSSLGMFAVLYVPLVEGGTGALSTYDQAFSWQMAGLVWQPATTPLSLCPDSGYFYSFESGFARCKALDCVSCPTFGAFLSPEYQNNSRNTVFTCTASCDTTNGHYLARARQSRACLPCNSRCLQCTGPSEYACAVCRVGGDWNGNSGHKCGTKGINPSLATSVLSIPLPQTYSAQDSPYTLLFWFYADFSAAVSGLFEATPWTISGLEPGSLALQDKSTSPPITMATATDLGAGWHHCALAVQVSPLGLQMAIDGLWVPLHTQPAAFRRLTGLYLGANALTGRVNGYITDLCLFRSALRAAYIRRIRGAMIDSSPFLDTAVDVSFLLTEGSGTTLFGRINGAEATVSLTGLQWASAPSMPTVCDPSNQSSTGSTCVPSPANCLFGLSPGCLICDSGKVAASDLLSCVDVCGSGEYLQHGRCNRCAWPCTACASSGLCTACASGQSPVGDLCPDPVIQTLFICPENEFVPINLVSGLTVTALTVEFWVNFYQVADYIYLTIGEVGLSIDAAKVTKVLIAGSSVGQFLGLIGWQHVAVVIDPLNISASNRLSVYYNGAKQTLSLYTGQSFDYLRVKLGSTPPTMSYGVREFRVWSSARTASQVLYNYQYFLPASMANPADLLLAVAFTDSNFRDRVSNTDFSFPSQFGLLPETHLKKWPVTTLGGFLCDYTTSTSPSGAACLPCHSSCGPTKHCAGPGPGQCEGCGFGYRLVSGVCKGLPVLVRTETACPGVSSVNVGALGTWTVDFWMVVSTATANTVGVVGAMSDSDALQVSLMSATLGVVSTIADTQTSSAATFSIGIWKHVALQSAPFSAASRTKVLLDGTPIFSTNTTLPLKRLTLGGSFGFNGFIMNLKIWSSWVDSAVITARSRVRKTAFAGLFTEWDFTSWTAADPAYSLNGTSSCLSQLAESQSPGVSDTLQTYPTLTPSTGLFTYTNVCPMKCIICINSSECLICSSSYIKTSVCTAQKDLTLTGNMAVSWPLAASIWEYSSTTLVAWLKPISGSGAVLKLTETSNSLEITVNSGILALLQAGTTMGNCAAVVNAWFYVAITLSNTGANCDIQLYCNNVLNAVGSLVAADYTDLVLAEASMTATRAVKMVKMYSRPLESALIVAFGGIWGPFYSDLVFNAPLKSFEEGVTDTISGQSVAVLSTSFIQSTVIVGICEAGQRFSDSLCLACEDLNCWKCAQTVTVCETCKIGFFSTAGYCLPCHFNCYTCENLPEKCNSCVRNATLSSTFTCVCNTHYFDLPGDSQHRCDQCHFSCLTCGSATASGCLTCAAPRMMVAGACLLYGLFPTIAETADFKSLCMTGSSSIPQSCRTHLKPYCCPASIPTHSSCLTLFGAFSCRPCTFNSDFTCNTAESLCWNPDFTLQPINDPCLMAIYPYCCLPHTSVFDCSAFNYQFNDCSNIGPPQIISSRWNPSMTSFNVTFDMGIDTTRLKTAPCGTYFLPVTLSRLGSNPICQFVSNNTVLLVNIGPGASLGNSTVTFLSNTIKATSKYSTFGFYQNVPIAVPNTAALQPEAVLIAPSLVASCASFVLDGLSSSGDFGRQLAYRWEIASNVTNIALENFVNQYSDYAISNGKITISAGILQAGTELNVTLRVMNSFGYSSETGAKVIILAQEIAQISINGGNYFTIRASQYAEYSVTIRPAACGKVPSNYAIQWDYYGTNCSNVLNFAQIRENQQNPWMFAIPEYTLFPGCKYTFSVSVTSQYSGLFGLTASANLTINVPISPLKVVIIGGDNRISHSQVYTLDASRSLDPDNTAATLVFSWTRCQASACTEVSKVSVYSFDPSGLTPGVKYVFTVQVRSGNRQGSDSKYVLVAETHIPALSILPLDQPLNPCTTNILVSTIKSASEISLLWTVINGGSAKFSSPVDKPSVAIAAFSLTPGATYTFQLQASTPSTTLAALLTAYVNSPPTSGWLTISPSSGMEMTTLYQFETQGWVDFEQNVPFTYQYFRVDGNRTAALNARGMSASQLIILAAGSDNNGNRVKVVLRAFDSYLAYSDIEQIITVLPGLKEQSRKAALASNMTTAILSSPANQSLPYIPSLVNSLSSSTFAIYTADNSTSPNNFTSERKVFSDLVTIIGNWWSTQSSQNSTAAVVADCLTSATQAPSVLSSKEIKQTLAVVNSLTGRNLDSAAAQSVLQVLSNLESANSIEQQRNNTELNSTQNSIRNQLIAVGRAAIQGSIRDQQPSIMTSTNFNGYFQRISPISVRSLNAVVNSTHNSSSAASISMPVDGLASYGIDPSFGLDMILLVSKNKPNRGGYANSSQTVNISAELVAGAETVKLVFEVSGSVNAYGEFIPQERTELQVGHLSTPVNITIPFQSASTSATTACAFYNISTEKWSDSGCFLINLNKSSNTATCSCTHLTEFSLSDVEDGAIAAGNSANADEATNFGALVDTNFTSNAIGLYIAVALLLVYGGLGLLCKWLDGKEARELEEFYNDPEKNMADAIAKNKDLYNIFVAGQEQAEPRSPASLAITTNEQKPEDELSVSALIYLNRYGLDVNSPIDTSKAEFNFQHVKPTAGDGLMFYEDRTVRTRRTCWEIVVTHHSILGLIFRISNTFPRFARLTILFCALFGELFVTGFFYDSGSAKEKETEMDIGGILGQYSWYDFFVAVMSALLVLPVILLVTLLLRKRKLTDDMSDHRKSKVSRCNSILNTAGYVLAWAWMLACSIEITLFAIKFNVFLTQANASKLWSLTYCLATIWDLLVTQFAKVLTRVGVMRFLYD